MSDVEETINRERRADLARSLANLRSALKDLETHGVAGDTPWEERQTHFEAIERAKQRIREMARELVSLS